MADRYISREWLLKELGDMLKGNGVRSEGEYESETVINAWKLLYSVVWNAPTFDQYQCSNKLLEARNFALKSHLDFLKEQFRHDEQDRDTAGLLVGAAEEKFYAGRCEATKEEIGWLERMVRGG